MTFASLRADVNEGLAGRISHRSKVQLGRAVSFTILFALASRAGFFQNGDERKWRKGNPGLHFPEQRHHEVQRLDLQQSEVGTAQHPPVQPPCGRAGTIEIQDLMYAESYALGEAGQLFSAVAAEVT